MKYMTENGSIFRADKGVVICINPNGTVTLHLGNGNTNNYISTEAFEDSLYKGCNLFLRPCFKDLMKEIGHE